MDAYNKPMVAHCIRNYLSVTANWVYSQIIGLKNYEVVVLAHHLENQDQFPWDRVYTYLLSKNPLWMNLQRRFIRPHHRYFASTLRAKDTALLHCHFGPMSYDCLKLKHSLKIPMISMFYGADITKIRPRWQRRYQKLFAQGELFLGEGSHMCQTIADAGCPYSKIRKLRLGVDLGKVPFVNRDLRPGEPVRILVSSTFTEKKGLPYAFKAFSQAIKKYPNMTLTVIGGYNNQVQKQIYDQCLGIMRKYGVGDKIELLGYVRHEEYIKQLMGSHIMIHPSITASDGNSEGGAPVTLIEASGSGLPVISSRHCDIPEVIVDGKSGILTKEKDTAGLVKAILELATTPEIWPDMAKFGRSHITENYNIERQMTILENYYKELT